MTDREKDLEQAYGLDQLFVNHEKTGKPLWRGGAFAELHFSGGEHADRRASLLQVWKRYFALFPRNLTHFLPNDGNRLVSITDMQFPTHFDEILATISSDEYFDGRLAGYEDSSKTAWPPTYMITGAGKWDRAKTELSNTYAHFPAPWVLENAESFISELLAWCHILKPRHGIAGLSVLRNPSSPAYSMKDSRIFPFLKRYPGLDYTDTSQFSLVTRREKEQKIRGSNWLTVLDDTFVSNLGGRAKLNEAIAQEPEVIIHDWDGGILIQAGVLPELGDSNQGRTPPHFKSVAKLVKDIRFEGYARKGYFRVPSPLEEVEETLKWVARFD
jgi:hypothetical protein